MLKCLFIKRKLYGYLDNGLSEEDNIKVRNHLAVCAHCRNKLDQMSALLNIAESKKMPEPKEAFWYDFSTELDTKLNSRLVPEFSFKPRLSHLRRPALAYAVFAMLLIITVSVHKFYQKSMLFVQSDSDSELIDDIVTLEELDPAGGLNQDEDAYLDELELIEQSESLS